MGSDDIVVGKSPSSRKSKTVIVEKFVQRAGASTPAESSPSPQEHRCGAMSEQPCYRGMTSTPQKLLHLVGCRDAKAKPTAR